MHKYIVLATLFALAALALALGPLAQLGEFSGHLFFNVTPGGTQTMQFGLINSDPNATIGYSLTYIILYKVANQTIYPNVTVYPASGLIVGNGNVQINVTVRVPWNAKPGTSWGGNVQFVQQAAPGNAGAYVRTGVVKIFNVVVGQPTFNPLSYVVPVAVVVGIAVGGGYYYFKVRKRPTAKRRAARAARKPARRRRGRATGRRRATRRRRR